MVGFVKIEGKTVKGVFERRLTRFSASVRVGDETLQSFLPNPGRMHELLTPGVEVVLREALSEKRRTAYDLIGVYHEGQKISVDSRVPNKLVLDALRKKELEEFSKYSVVKPEYPYGHGRFDFLLSDGYERCLLEVKSCTLVKDGVAMFPDAETRRGRRHVEDLLRAKNEDYRACILFVVQRTDANVFSPDDEADPEFGKVLRRAAAQGVEIYAYRSEFTEDRIVLREKIKTKL
jgi:sugar fermentation stimulation protein A